LLWFTTESSFCTQFIINLIKSVYFFRCYSSSFTETFSFPQTQLSISYKRLFLLHVIPFLTSTRWLFLFRPVSLPVSPPPSLIRFSDKNSIWLYLYLNCYRSCSHPYHLTLYCFMFRLLTTSIYCSNGLIAGLCKGTSGKEFSWPCLDTTPTVFIPINLLQ
jgi:hypothetical protein